MHKAFKKWWLLGDWVNGPLQRRESNGVASLGSDPELLDIFNQQKAGFSKTIGVLWGGHGI